MDMGIAATGSAQARAAASPPTRSLWIAGAVLAAVGVAAFAVQVAGASFAGSSEYPWGFFIGMFYAAASTGAGLLVVVGVACWAGALGAQLASRLYAVACAVLIAASLLIVVDLGNPAAILMTYASANAASPVFFDAIVLPLCIVFAVVAAVMTAKAAAAGGAASRAVAAVGVAAGFALLGVEAWLLTTCSGKDAWGVLLGAGPALLQAAALGVAVVAAADAERPLWRALLGALMLVVTLSFAFDVLLNQAADTVLGRQLAAIAASPLFWVAAVLGIGAALAAFASSRSAVVRAAAASAVVAVSLLKLAALAGTQSVVAIAQLEAAGAFPFNPLELAVFAGVVGVGVLAYAAGLLVLAGQSKEVQA